MGACASHPPVAASPPPSPTPVSPPRSPPLSPPRSPAPPLSPTRTASTASLPTSSGSSFRSGTATRGERRFSPLRHALSPAALAAAAADAAAGDTDSDRPTFLRDAVDDGGGGGGGQILAAGSLDAARAVAVAASPPRRARPAAASVVATTDDDDSMAGWRAIAADVMAEGGGSVEASQPPPQQAVETEEDATPPLALPPAGRFLLAYEINNPLGSGAFGSVVAVRRRADGARFVAKVGRDATPAAARAALAEVRAMQALAACPHVVRIEEAFVDDCHRVVVVMEAAAGGDVAAWLARRAAPVPDAACVSIFAQIVAALAAAHNAGIVHRDVKLSNVLIKRRLGGDGGGNAATTVDGRDDQGRRNTNTPPPPLVVALGDFGLAATLSATPTVAGTPACMAPEVLAGTRGCGRPPADVWAAGVALWTLAAGRPPYAGDSVGALAGRVVAGPVPALPAGVGGADVRALLAATLVKDPALRPSAADLLTFPAVAAALRAVEAGEQEADKGVGAAGAAGGPAVEKREQEADKGAGAAGGPARDHTEGPAVVVQPATASVDDEDDDAAALAKLVALQKVVGMGV